MVNFKEIFPADVVSVQGKPYLFSNARVDRKSIPKHYVAYDVRDECDGNFWQIMDLVRVNHWGTIIGREDIELDDEGNYWCDPCEDNEDLSSEGAFLGFTMEDPADFKIWYGSLKGYAKAASKQKEVKR